MGGKDGAKKNCRPGLILEQKIQEKKNPVGLRTHKIELLVRYRRYKAENTSE